MRFSVSAMCYCVFVSMHTSILLCLWVCCVRRMILLSISTPGNKGQKRLGSRSWALAKRVTISASATDGKVSTTWITVLSSPRPTLTVHAQQHTHSQKSERAAASRAAASLLKNDRHVYLNISIYTVSNQSRDTYAWICTYIYVHIYIHIFIYVYVYIYIYIFINVCVYIYVYYMDIYLYIYIYMMYIYICVCICTYMNIYVYMYEYMYIYLYIYIYLSMHVCVYIHIYVLYIYICTHVYIYIYTWFISIHICIYINVYMYIYMCIYIYIYIHVYMYIHNTDPYVWLCTAINAPFFTGGMSKRLHVLEGPH